MERLAEETAVSPAPLSFSRSHTVTTPSGQDAFALRLLKGRLMLIALASALALAAIVAVGTGALPIRPAQVVAILAHHLGTSLPVEYAPAQDGVLWALRLPRVVLACIVGGSLALCGAAMQGMFRNPLADPALLGVSSGAALGAVISIVVFGKVGWIMPAWTLPVCAFLGALGAMVVVHLLGQQHGRTSLTGLLLAGIAVNSFGGATIGLLTFLASDAQLRSITFWSLGSLGAASWSLCGVLLPLTLIPAVFILRQARLLNALLLGEREAGHLGFPVESRKRLLLLCSALLVGSAASMVGIISFVGLVAPHLVRLTLGPDHRFLLPGSTLLGALLLVVADTVCRTVAAPAEIPIGVATAFLGAPFFLWLLRREQRALS